MNTAASDVVIVRIVKPISCEPFSDASSGFSPASMWRTMFSSITIASSDRDEPRGQRRGHRQNREADLLRAFQRRFERLLAGLHVADDVLEHHDRVIRSG